MKFRTSCTVFGLVALLVLTSVGCRTKDKPDEVTEEIVQPPPSQRTPVIPADLPPSVTISYADSTDRLETVPAEERDDQIRDWTVLGLASFLRIDTETLRDFSYDRAPIRDSLFAGITTEAVGPGRFLPDGSGTLHLLVPASDPHAARTVGLLLDDYRKDSGVDPTNIRLHCYTISHKKKTVTVETGPFRPVSEVRTENGYVEMEVQDLASLEDFLARTQHLSKLENRGGTLWASGWNWPSTLEGRITTEDISVLQRGYRRAKEGLGSEPGFSLDPGEPLRGGFLELIGLVKSVGYPDTEKFIREFSEWKELSKENQRIDRLISLSLQYPDLTKLFLAADQNEPVFQFARYDGGVEGTEVGMTYFYTDLVAKAWPMERGTGVPAGKVSGFISDLQARTPWGHCSSEAESGRLWFGLREEAVRVYQGRVELGSLATRLFSLVQDTNERGKEIEPSYSFGRIMWWWDRHYQAMADYEPQYHRLDQLMRWGAAIAWLVNQNSVLLPEVAEDTIRTDRHFFNWLAKHPSLKWHWAIPVVKPEGVDTEALLTVFSANYEDCGYAHNFWGGGISGPERKRLSEIEKFVPDLEPSVARAGARADGTYFSSLARAGRIVSENVSRDLQPVRDSRAVVKVVAKGRKVWSISTLKAWVGETAERIITLSLESAGHRLIQRVGVQGVEMGELSVTAEGSVATVTWNPGLLDRAHRALSTLQEKLPGRSVEKAAVSARGASFVYSDAATGKTFLRIDGNYESRWMTIEKGAPEPGAEMAFRLGQPGEREQGGEPTWFTARFTDPPTIKTKEDKEAEWLQLEFKPGGPARISGPPDPPGSNAKLLTFDFGGEGPKGQFYIYAERDKVDKVKVRRDDPHFGLRRTREGAAVPDPETLQRLYDAQQAAKSSEDGYKRGIPLRGSRSMALAHVDGISIVQPAHPWYQRVQKALRQVANADGDPLFRTDGPQALLVDAQPKVQPERSHKTMSSSGLLSLLRDEADPTKPRGPPVYFESGLAKELLVEGKIPPAPTGRSLQVRVVTVELTDGIRGGGDILAWDGAEWTQPVGSGSAPPPEIKLSRQVRLVYGSSDCEKEPQISSLNRCDTLEL